MSLLAVSSAYADKKTWALLTAAKGADGKEFVMSSGVTEKTGELVVQYANDADEALNRYTKDTIAAICSNKEFYSSAPEHLAQKIDRQADAYDAFRDSLGNSLYDNIRVTDREKLRQFVDETFHVEVKKPERYGDPVRYGKQKPTDVINALCKE